MIKLNESINIRYSGDNLNRVIVVETYIPLKRFNIKNYTDICINLGKN